MTNSYIYFKFSFQEKQIKEFIANGKYEEAIQVYQGIPIVSTAVLHLIGSLYADKLGDYDVAISCFEQAIKTHEKV